MQMRMDGKPTVDDLLTALSTVSHNALRLAWLSISGAVNEPWMNHEYYQSHFVFASGFLLSFAVI